MPGSIMTPAEVETAVAILEAEIWKPASTVALIRLSGTIDGLRAQLKADARDPATVAAEIEAPYQQRIIDKDEELVEVRQRLQTAREALARLADEGRWLRWEGKVNEAWVLSVAGRALEESAGTQHDAAKAGMGEPKEVSA